MQNLKSNPGTTQELVVDEKLETPYGEFEQEEARIEAATGGAFAVIFSSFKHRNYQLWFGGQLISVIGTWMQAIAQGWLVYQISHSEFALGFVSFASAVPVLFISPFGGVITDLMPKRMLLVITQTSAMLLAFILAALTFTGVVQVWHIYILAALLGVVNAFDAPARQAFVVDMVSREDMSNAIAMNSMMFNGARVVGPALGGLLLGWLGTSWCFLINGISYIAVITGLLMMVVPRQPMPKKVEKPLRQFVDGLQYSRNRPEIMGMILLASVFSIFGMSYAALLPAFVDKSLHAGATGYGIINAAIGLGAVLGAFYVAYKGNAGDRGRMVLLGGLLYPVILILFGYNTFFLAALLLAAMMGIGFMLLLNNLNSLLQLQVDDRMRGRVMGLYSLSFFGFAPFGSLAAGAIAEKLPLNLTIGLSAAAMLLLAAIILWKVPQIAKLS